MEYVARLIAAILTCFLVNSFVTMLKRPKDNESNMVVEPKFTLIMGIICSVLFLVPTIILLFFEDEKYIGAAVVCAVFCLLGLVLVVGYVNCRIIYNAEDFTFKTFWGKKRTIRYEDLTAIKGEKNVKLYAGRCVISVSEMTVNKDKFISFAKTQYKKYHNGADIPKVVKKDLFNNHVENAGEMICGFGILVVCMLGFTILLAALTVPKKATDFDTRSIIVDSYETSKEQLLIFDDTGAMYEIDDYNAVLTNPDEFMNELDSGPLLVMSVLYYANDGEPFYAVSAIKNADGTKQYLSYSAWVDNEWKSYALWIGLFVILDLVIFGLIGFIIYVGRNPDKFSDKVLHRFFKPEYIHRD